MTHLSRILTVFGLFLTVFQTNAQGYYNSADAKVFQLDAEEYGIVQGVVDSATALANRYALEQAMADAKAQGYRTLKASDLDIYLEVTTITSQTNPNYYSFEEGVNTVSGLSLDFTDNCTFRVFPNDEGQYSLFTTTYSKNLTIKGGTYIGDRFEHIGGDQRGRLIQVIAGTNILVDGTTTSESFGDGIVVSSRYQTWHNEYSPSNNIIIRNSTQSRNRRQGISLTDGYKIIVENCRGIDNGTNIANSDGSLPRCYIDVEAQRRADSGGNLILDEYIHDVIIRNNFERGSGNSSILVHIGDSVTVENNDVQRAIVFDMGSQIKILNNKVVGSGYGTGISANRENRSTYDNYIIGNTISGVDAGIKMSGKGTTVQNNTVTDFNKGLVFKDPRAGVVENNTFISDVSGSYGAYFHITSADSMNISNNVFKGERDAAAFVNMNAGEPEKRVVFTDNEFLGARSISMINSNGIEFNENSFNVGVDIKGNDNLSFKNNTINAGGSSGIHLLDVQSGNVSILDNAINSNTTPVRIDVYPSIFEYARNILNGELQAQ